MTRPQEAADLAAGLDQDQRSTVLYLLALEHPGLTAAAITRITALRAAGAAGEGEGR